MVLEPHQLLRPTRPRVPFVFALAPSMIVLRLVQIFGTYRKLSLPALTLTRRLLSPGNKRTKSVCSPTAAHSQRTRSASVRTVERRSRLDAVPLLRETLLLVGAL